MSEGRSEWWLGPASVAATAAIVALARTWRVEYEPVSAARIRGFFTGGGCIFALWHSRLLPLTWAHRGRGAAVLISLHRDGELIARIARRLGYLTPRGSSTRGGDEGARAMLRHAAEGRVLAVTPDGPRGPARRAKPGVVWLAATAGIPVVPAAAAASRARVLRSWDGFRVPGPFARVLVAYGEPIHVPPDLGGTDPEAWAERIGRAIDEVTERTAAAMGERP